MLLGLALAAVVGYLVASSGPAFAEPRRRRLAFPTARLLIAAPCAICGRPRCPLR